MSIPVLNRLFIVIRHVPIRKAHVNRSKGRNPQIHQHTSYQTELPPRPNSSATDPTISQLPSQPLVPSLQNPSMTGPNHSIFRANPFPEVTDLICRLPLPTLFYWLEAIHLEDLLRLWVRSDWTITILRQGVLKAPTRISHPEFQGPLNVPWIPQKIEELFQTYSRISYWVLSTVIVC